MITYNSEKVKMPKIKKRETTAWIKQVAQSYGKKVGDIGYMFVEDEKLLEVNSEYLQHDYYTLSSDYSWSAPFDRNKRQRAWRKRNYGGCRE